MRLFLFLSVDGGDDQPPGNGMTLPEGGSASRFHQAIIKHLHACAHHEKTPTSVEAGEHATERGDAREIGPHVTPRPRALDVQTNCRPGPSFRRDGAGNCLLKIQYIINLPLQNLAFVAVILGLKCRWRRQEGSYQDVGIWSWWFNLSFPASSSELSATMWD